MSSNIDPGLAAGSFEQGPQFAALADELAARAAVDPLVASVREAMDPATIPLFYLGLQDLDITFSRYAVDHRRGALEDIVPIQEQFYEGSLPRRGITKASLTRAMEKWYEKTQERGWRLGDPEALRPKTNIQQIQAVERAGLNRSAALRPLLTNLQCLYFGQCAPVWDEGEAPAPTLSEKDAQHLFGSPTVPEDFSFESFAERVALVNDLNLSREMLDARFNSFIGVASFELTRISLENLILFAQVTNGAAKIVQRIIVDYQEVLLGADITGKQEMMTKAARIMHSQARVIPGARHRQAVHLLGSSLENTAVSMDEWLQFFTNVYETLDLELPPLLNYNEVEEPPEPVPVVLGTTTVSRVVEVEPAREEPETVVAHEPDPEIIEMVAARTAALTQEIQQFTASWRLSSKVLKQQGLDPLVRRLVDGLRNPLGQVLLDPRPKDNALEVVGMLANLNRLAQRFDAKGLKQHFEGAAKQRETLLAAGMSVRQLAADNGVNGPSFPHIIDIRAHMQLLAKDWNAYRQLILNAWHPNEAVAVADRIAAALAAIAD